MTSDLDIYKTAEVLLANHGDEAELRAAEQHDAMLSNGNMEGMAVWLRVIAAIRELRGGVAPPGHSVH